MDKSRILLSRDRKAVEAMCRKLQALLKRSSVLDTAVNTGRRLQASRLETMPVILDVPQRPQNILQPNAIHFD